MPIQQITANGAQGYQARAYYGKHRVLTRFFAFDKHGGQEQALAKAEAAEAELRAEAEQLKKPAPAPGPRTKPQANSSTGLDGISIRLRQYATMSTRIVQVTWQEGGRQRGTYFSTERLGKKEALAAAMRLRAGKTNRPEPGEQEIEAAYQRLVQEGRL